MRDVLERIAVALERIADQRDSMIQEAQAIETPRELSAGEVIDIVCAVTNLNILEKNRQPQFVWARNAAMTIMRERLSLTMPQIGELMGLDFSTVSHGLNKFNATKNNWPSWYKQRWDQINILLGPRAENVA